MSLNPPLAEGPNAAGRTEVVPEPYPGEYFYLMRDNVDFSVTVNGVQYAASGRVYLTSNRLCLQEKGSCKSGATPLTQKKSGVQWAALDVPLHLIEGHKYNQPIFSSNYLSGTCLAVPGGGFEEGAVAQWKISFPRGGVGSLYPLFLKLMRAIEQNSERKEAIYGMGADSGSGAINPVVARELGRGYVDPNDPSAFYMEQVVARK